MPRSIFCIFLVIMVFGCGSPEESRSVDSVVPPVPAPAIHVYSFQTFENIDSTGAPHGIGYDIYDGDKRIIHQVNIPGEPGNDGFASKEEAERVAKFVTEKLQKAEGFPTVTREDLVRMNITLQTH